jgi:hypothetical protein
MGEMVNADLPFAQNDSGAAAGTGISGAFRGTAGIDTFAIKESG